MTDDILAAELAELLDLIRESVEPSPAVEELAERLNTVKNILHTNSNPLNRILEALRGIRLPSTVDEELRAILLLGTSASDEQIIEKVRQKISREHELAQRLSGVRIRLARALGLPPGEHSAEDLAERVLMGSDLWVGRS